MRKSIRGQGRRVIRNVRVAAKLLDNQRLSPLGNLIQLIAAEKDLMEQDNYVHPCTRCPETSVRLFWNVLLCQHPCTRCLCFVIHRGDV